MFEILTNHHDRRFILTTYLRTPETGIFRDIRTFCVIFGRDQSKTLFLSIEKSRVETRVLLRRFARVNDLRFCRTGNNARKSFARYRPHLTRNVDTTE